MIEGLSKDFESRVRLGIMSMLMVNDWVEFKEMKNLLKLTDGNLASHIIALDKKELIEVKKEFAGKIPKTSYRATVEGRKQFEAHLEALENILKNTQS